jgi:hypothetical protein
MPAREAAVPPVGRGSARTDRSAYVAACGRYAQLERARLESEIAERDARLATLGAELRAVSRERANARRRLAGVDAMLAAEADRFERDFDVLVSMPGVRELELGEDQIRIMTEPIVIEHEGARYDIGDFAVEVDLDRGIRIINLRNTSSSTGWDHPHVQGTVPCLGNLQEGCEILLGQLELVPLVSLLLQFLDTYDPTTAYGPITLWRRTTP